MNASYNKVFLIGKIAKLPMLKYTQRGTAIVELELITNRTFCDEQGKNTDEPTTVHVTFFARQAEVCAEYLTKDSPIFVEGRLDAGKGKRLQVTGEQFQFLK